MDILEYGVPASWRREFTVQGFDPVDQSLQNFVEFCTRLESCKPSKGKPKGEKPSKSKPQGKERLKSQQRLRPQQEKKESSTVRCTDGILPTTLTKVTN
eukprot:15346093-Ditylum_brightwellii.AAC.1